MPVTPVHGLTKTLAFIVLGLFLCGTIARNHTYGTAIRLQEDIVLKSPRKSRAHLNLGALYMQAGRLSEAIQEFETVIRLADVSCTADCERFNYGAAAVANLSGIYFDLSHRYYLGRDPVQGEAYLNRADRILEYGEKYKPTVSVIAHRMVLALRRGQPHDALRVVSVAESQGFNSWILLLNKAEALRLLGRCDEARVVYQEARQADRVASLNWTMPTCQL